MLGIVSVLLLGALALANGGVVSKSQRSGEFNRYYLYTSTQTGVEITAGAVGSFLTTRKTVVIIHGHEASYETSLNPDIIRLLLRSGEDLNIISVDWSVYAGMSYTLAEAAAPSVGLHLANFLVAINVVPTNTHLIGFNLGAHIAGFAGRRLDGLARITGLDPSKTINRLTKTDANYVEVIHTDTIGVLSNGIADQMGHADFYPNGGGTQPGCLALHQCNHDRAWLFFAASIDLNGSVFNANCCTTILQKDLNQCLAGVPIPMGDNTLFNKMPHMDIKTSSSMPDVVENSFLRLDPVMPQQTVNFTCASGIYRVNTGSEYPF